MNKKKYQTAMDNLKFREDFSSQTISEVKKASAKRSNFKPVYIWIRSAVYLALILILTLPFWSKIREGGQENETITSFTISSIQEKSSLPIPTEEIIISDAEATETSVFKNEKTDILSPSKKIVISSKYPSTMQVSHVGLPGTMITEENVRDAMDDPQNIDSLFFVEILPIPTLTALEMEDFSYDIYIYGDLEIAQQPALNSLAEDVYPYNEYNIDHGDNISEEEWEKVIEDAILSSVNKQYNEEIEKYAREIQPQINHAATDWKKRECIRLQNLGYDVFFFGEESLVGLLSWEQLNAFETHPECSYIIDWVQKRGDDGIGVIVDYCEELFSSTSLAR